MNRDLVEDSIEDKKSKGAFEDLYRFSSSDRSGQLVPLCNRLRIKERICIFPYLSRCAYIRFGFACLVLGSTE